MAISSRFHILFIVDFKGFLKDRLIKVDKVGDIFLGTLSLEQARIHIRVIIVVGGFLLYLMQTQIALDMELIGF